MILLPSEGIELEIVINLGEALSKQSGYETPVPFETTANDP